MTMKPDFEQRTERLVKSIVDLRQRALSEGYSKEEVATAIFGTGFACLLASGMNADEAIAGARQVIERNGASLQ